MPQQFEKVKILHVQWVVNARVDALAVVIASFSVPGREIRRITISRGRLLTPFLETPLELMFEEACGVEIVAEPVEDWRILFLHFLERGRLPDDPIKRIEGRRRSTKFVILEKVLYRCSLDGIIL